jgi:hypothetical protein
MSQRLYISFCHICFSFVLCYIWDRLIFLTVIHDLMMEPLNSIILTILNLSLLQNQIVPWSRGKHGNWEEEISGKMNGMQGEMHTMWGERRTELQATSPSLKQFFFIHLLYWVYFISFIIFWPSFSDPLESNHIFNCWTRRRHGWCIELDIDWRMKEANEIFQFVYFISL